MSETAHAKLSASGSKKWLGCPGSVNAEQGIPNPDNEFSLYGSAAHALAERCLTNRENASAYAGCEAVKETEKSDFIIIGEFNAPCYKKIPVDDEMMAGVQVYLDFCRNIKGDQEWVERKVFFGNTVPGQWGTADFIKVLSNFVHMLDPLRSNAFEEIRIINVVDLKFGKGVRVFAENNSQAMLYGLGVINDLDFLYDFEDNDIVNVIIVQPRLDHIDQWQISVGDLRAWADSKVKPAALLALTEDAPRIAGSWCTDGFCRRGKIGCKTETAYYTALTQGDFTDVETMVDTPLRNMDNLTNDEIGMLLPLLPGMYKWGKAIEAHAYNEKMAGRPVLGYKVVQGKPGNRFFPDEDKMLRWVLRNKLVGKKAEPEGKLTIAPISDKRTEVEVIPETDDFNDVTLGEK